MIRSLLLTSTLGILVGQVGCNAVLGIDEAHVDPRLELEEPTTSVSTSIEQSPEPTIESPDVDSGAAAPIEDDEHDDDDDGKESEPNEESKKPTMPGKPGNAGAGGSSGDDPPGLGGGPALDDGAPADADAGTKPVDEPTLCQKYCSEVMELCTDSVSQYRDMFQCLKVCEYLPEGKLTSDDNENTVACRLRYASKARYAAGTEYEAYCRQAGPGGDGRCGSNCDGYCALMEGVCSADVSDVYHFENQQDCMETCNDLPTSNLAYSATNVDVADGNHVQCRLFHVTSAAMLDAEEHCEHAMGFTLCEAAPTE